MGSTEFWIDLKRTKETGEDIAKLQMKIKKLEQKIRSVEKALSADSYGDIKRVLEVLAGDMKDEADACGEYGKMLVDIVNLYAEAEAKIVSTSLKQPNFKMETSSGVDVESSWKSKMRDLVNRLRNLMEDMIKRWTGDKNIEPYEIDSIVFDDEGQYGGHQGSPKDIKDIERRDALYEIIRENIPEFKKGDLTSYLKKLNNEGCGYVALTNAILMNFEGREEEFEQIFGYPMYDENGELNYDLLLVDLYSSWDNIPIGGDEVDEWDDYKEDKDGKREVYDYWSDETGSGSSQYDREYYLESFMEEHGIQANVETDVKVDIYNFDNISESGKTVIVAFRDGNLYNEDGSVAQTIQGGHAMVVTGVTSDGRLVVSSWGGVYYIDPDENANLYYDDSNHKTSMTFSTIEFE